MNQDEVAILKEALCEQYHVMKKLYVELEEERQAAASAADEALSMILRLQVEKAEEKMEAVQYKKLSEEKMRHAEESLVIFEEIIHQKEMEIASLKHQVQVFDHRLLIANANSHGIGELNICNLSLNMSRAFLEETSSHGHFKRNISMPPIRYERLCSGMDSSLFSSGQSIFGEVGEYANQVGNYDLNVGLKQLMKCQKDKETAGLIESTTVKDAFQMSTTIKPLGFEEESYMCNLASREVTFGGTTMNVNTASVSILSSQAAISESRTETDRIGSSYESIDLEENRRYVVRNQDIYEVLKSHTDPSFTDAFDQLCHKPVSEPKGKAKITVSLLQEAIDNNQEDIDVPQKSLICHRHESMLSEPRETTSLDYQQNHLKSKSEITPSFTNVEQLKQQVQQLEDDGKILKLDDSLGSSEQLKTLVEICDQLNSIQLHLRTFIFRKQPPQDNHLFVSLVEAMLHFSI